MAITINTNHQPGRIEIPYAVYIAPLSGFVLPKAHTKTKTEYGRVCNREKNDNDDTLVYMMCKLIPNPAVFDDASQFPDNDPIYTFLKTIS